MVILDIKLGQDDDEALLDQLIHTIHDLSCGNCMIWAKEGRVVKRIKELSPGQKYGYICMNETYKNREDRMDDPLRMIQPEIVGMHHEMVSLYNTDLIRAASKHTISWTTNSEDSIKRVLKGSVDGLVTNYPQLAMRILDDLWIKCGKGDQVEL